MFIEVVVTNDYVQPVKLMDNRIATCLRDPQQERATEEKRGVRGGSRTNSLQTPVVYKQAVETDV